MENNNIPALVNPFIVRYSLFIKSTNLSIILSPQLASFTFSLMYFPKSQYKEINSSDGKANQSLSKAVGEEDYPNTKILDTYSLEFLDLPNHYSEKDLKKAIISNMKD